MDASPGEKHVQERDITAHLRGLVDGCFEEGQYEAGLTTLDQLRSPNYRPAASHIRQLICIALGASTTVEEEAFASPVKNKRKGTDYGLGPGELPASISQQKFTYLPSPEATTAARRILLSYGLTNTPKSLFRALPSYPLDSASAAIGGRIDGADLEHDGEDSYIARVAQCVGSAPNIWAVIKPGFVNWDIPMSDGATRKSKEKKRAMKLREELDDDYLTTGDEPVSVVGDEAWSVLEWLVLIIFDRDERRAVEDNKPCYSPLLLSSIPSTGNKDPRWNASLALDVVFCCLNQELEERINLGRTLLRQLINLTSTTIFDLQMFVGALFSRFPVERWDTLGPILANLPESLATLHFKIHLCMRYLGDISKSRSALLQKRAQPRAPRKGRGDHSTRSRDQADATRSITRTYSSFSWSSTIEPLVSHRLGGHPNAITYNRIKFELLSSYGSLQGHQLPSARDTDWRASLLDDGTFRNVIETAFDCAPSEDDERCHSKTIGELLLAMVPTLQNAVK